ncbi:hypothetical protein HPB51_011964 [Rhipicephalus microplus]|uniref:Uncharacterized protein n=1 Tax=Rhipicephalus microplus TaxID=6941 RepID=A0A9J6F260_RHIMP|nr:hypothetical protein HPB51_011964 [Rhipicephalus microplus]
MLRGRALRRCGRRGLRMALQRGTDFGPSSHELALLELVRWHPGVLSKPGEPRLVLVVALRWISHCQDDPPLVEAALEALGSLLLRHRAGLRECCFELLMSVFHLLASPSASVRHKALGLTLKAAVYPEQGLDYETHPLRAKWLTIPTGKSVGNALVAKPYDNNPTGCHSR